VIEYVKNAVIIGGENGDRYYSFHERDDKQTRIAGGWFKDDAEAEEWFKKYYPAGYARGAEMRCYGG
jgi:hypothetical protein